MANPNYSPILMLAQHLAQNLAAAQPQLHAAASAAAAAATVSPEAALAAAVRHDQEQALAAAALASIAKAPASPKGRRQPVVAALGSIVAGVSGACPSTPGGSVTIDAGVAARGAPAARESGQSLGVAATQEPLLAPSEVPRCHLHRKVNKSCRYCKAHTAFQDQKSKEMEERKSAVLEKLKEDPGRISRPDSMDKIPLPNLVHFPQVMKERLLNYRYYNQVLATQDLPEIKEALYECDTCEPESRGQSTLDLMPSTFFCCVYRLLQIKLTEGQLQALMNNRSRWVRCAGFLYVRLGVAQERYWELLSDHLMDDEVFVLFPGKDAVPMTEGQYVENLLTKEKYVDINLPRIAVAMRRTINERLVLYEQFRRRYEANLEALDKYEDPHGGVVVEVCDCDGEWSVGQTVGSRSPGRRRVTVPVRLDDGGDRDVSIGMLIRKDSGQAASGDLTRSRGRCNTELLEEYRRSQRDAATASGKDYCKTSGRHTVHAGGVTFVCGDGEQSKKKKTGSDSDEERARDSKRRREKESEHQQKMAAIMEKYCSGSGRGTSAPGRFGGRGDLSGPDRIRLG
eukprot:TRINITY_DN61369_c0_g1_i1.p1 TRINITY_DN61369_c0_g1~~TRINITY_DN61369_c0_g1_i1.p1  ORF type:complete len:601 (+),score=98.58 TRINITY_DN61369_c0_g1_i1:95-1804(+)